MVPFIGKDLDEAIDSNEIKLVYKEDGFVLIITTIGIQ
jgi:hypothetical protein